MYIPQLTKQFNVDADEIYEYISQQFGVARGEEFADDLVEFTKSLAAANVRSDKIVKNTEVMYVLFQKRNRVYYTVIDNKFVFLNIIDINKSNVKK